MNAVRVLQMENKSPFTFSKHWKRASCKECMTKFSTSTRISSLPDILRMAGKLSSKLLKKHFFANTNQFNIYVLFHFLSFVRKFMSQRALNLITNVREDDLFLCLDADELPKREVRFFFLFYIMYWKYWRLGCQAQWTFSCPVASFTIFFLCRISLWS